MNAILDFSKLDKFIDVLFNTLVYKDTRKKKNHKEINHFDFSFDNSAGFNNKTMKSAKTLSKMF